MKYWATIFLFVIIKTALSQAPNQAIIKKHSIGFTIHIASFERFISSENESQTSILEARSRFYFSAYNYYGLTYQYTLNRSVKFRLGATNYSEIVETRTFEKGFIGSTIDKTIKGKLSYFSIPLSIRFFPFNTDRREDYDGAYIEIRCNSDFIYDEYITSYNNIPFNKFSQTSIPSYVTVYREKVEYRNTEIGYNRSSVSLGIGHEIEMKQVGFYYGICAQFESFHQMKNTFSKIKTGKFTLLDLGFNYRF